MTMRAVSLSRFNPVALLVSAALCAGPAMAAGLHMRVGNVVTTDTTSLALFYAIKSGAFARAGLDPEVKSFVQSSQKYDAFKAGALDVDIDMGAVTAAQLYSAGVPLVVLRAYTPADIWAVVVKKDSPIRKLEELKGKKFGVVSLSGINFAVTYFAFKTVGLDLLKDVQLTALPPAALRTALEKGDLQGGTTYEPHLSEAVKAGGVRILARPGEMYEQKYGAPFFALGNAARKDFYENNKEAMARFDGVMEKAYAELPSHLDEAAEALASGVPELGIKKEQVKELTRPYLKSFIKSKNDPAFLEQIQKYYDRLHEIGQLREPVKASEFWIKP
jgi:ABC-type nitrate/sulfonate/bicarbonate transport system substrate-binding protein